MSEQELLAAMESMIEKKIPRKTNNLQSTLLAVLVAVVFWVGNTVNDNQVAIAGIQVTVTGIKEDIAATNNNTKTLIGEHRLYDQHVEQFKAYKKLNRLDHTQFKQHKHLQQTSKTIKSQQVYTINSPDLWE